VHEPVDSAVVSAREVVGPALGGSWVEEIDDVGLDRRLDLGSERLE
jgi:hypothetical protein